MRDVEIPNWLKGLPLAPEFRPTDTEFADPIAYISKIEKEASAFGICKVIPPLPKPSRKYVLHNLNRTLSKCPELGSNVNVGASLNSENVGGGSSGGGEVRAVFTTRQQELGQSGKKVKGTVEGHSVGGQRQVWQSGEVYTLEQFEEKSKTFAKNQLSLVKEVSPLVIETMFWKASSEKPIYVEYANDVPGSGFGEPEGSFHYFHRQRRRRRRKGTFDRNNRESCGSKDHLVEDNSCYGNKRVEVINSHTEASSTSACCPTDESTTILMQRCSNPSNEMVGTSGWKLANSPWNLQVIARSPGSLTRFMRDDIPGVTSPMVYVGMLFSWFAWHVEDHELHSLNYLHMGSPKTWYSVPGECAFNFEEVIRLHAYGENTDHLGALGRLGEKTTLLSPEVVVASGIPCCRLVQNPGEFVVTFPRAYHVGFSHGFNCGEAANFATPKWLSVAKEAGVRRAVMNYLPMLSHQQLLYLLTMSFVSRVPRSLLPGGRSSRLRDRQKDERELSVKKAFVEDILKENHLMNVLQKNPSCHVITWKLDLLPSSCKPPEPCSKNDTVATPSSEKNQSQDHPTQDLYSEMSLYMESLNDFHDDDVDDLLCDYQLDSGALPCVSCGILGFPFMAVVQPTEQAARDLLADDPDIIQQWGSSEAVDSQSLGPRDRVEESTADPRNSNDENLLHLPCRDSSSAELSQSFPRTLHSLSSETMESSANRCGRPWNLSLGNLRPRIFCLEHAIQTVDLLSSKGGATVLGLCHSDFQKMKAHAAVVAEEIGCPFTYKEISLDNASQEDLDLIEHATDNQEKKECMQDWTSKLSINLEQCVKMRKDFQTVQNAFMLDRLSADYNLASNSWKWQLRRSRSQRNSNPPRLKKPSSSRRTNKVEESGAKGDAEMTKKEDKPIIQYNRRNYKHKSSVDENKLASRDLSVCCVDPSRKIRNEFENTGDRGQQAENVPPRFGSSHSIGTTILQDENQGSEDPQTIIFPSEDVDSLAVTTSIAQSIPAPSGNCFSNELVEKNNKGDSTLSHSEELSKNQVAEERTQQNDTADSQNCDRDLVVEEASILGNSPSGVHDSKETRQVAEERTQRNDPAYSQNCNRDLVIEEASVPGNSPSGVHDSKETHQAHTETTEADGRGPTGVLSSCSTLDGKMQQEMQTTSADGHEASVSSDATLENKQSEADSPEQLHSTGESISSRENQESDRNISTQAQSQLTAKTGRKRRREADMLNEEEHSFGTFIKSPCECLRSRSKREDGPGNLLKLENPIESKKADGKVSDAAVLRNNKKKDQQKKGSLRCNIESCRMTFQTKAELAKHKRNVCHVEGCGKKFNSHKSAVSHQRVHDDDRPLKCSWKGCKMTFKWAWARTEHLRVHTGERPYKCKVEGCGRTFRFVSDYSRHRRKTDHYVK